MTSTPVKDVGSILTSLTPQTGSRGMGTAIGQTGFQTVLNNQSQRDMGNRAADNRAADSRAASGKKPVDQSSQTRPGDSLKAKNADRVQTGQTKTASAENGGEELTSGELEEAMAVLETAAVELIQQTAELLGISVEEVQGIMEDLGLEKLDVLDPAQLGKLFLQAAGVEDSYALVTDGELYGSYQELMKQLEAGLQDCGGQLDAEPLQLQTLLESLKEQPAERRETPLAELSKEEGIPEAGAENQNQISLPDTAKVEEPKDNAPDSREQGQKESHSDNKEQGGNLFIQNLKTEAFQPEVQQTAEMADIAQADTENIMRQIMDYMKVQLKADTTHLEMQLHPASLGTVQVQLASRGGAVTASFIAQNEAVKAALESQMVQLVERFDEQGVKVEAIEVTVQTHEFERNLDQGRGRDQQEGGPARKGRTRRINLNDALTVEDMEEADALAAEIMAANGNTVDYTA